MNPFLRPVWDLFSELLYPPTLFAILIAIGLWQSPRKRWARWLAGLALTALIIFSTTLFSYSVSGWYAPALPINPAEVRSLSRDDAIIVVLGGGTIRGALEYPGGETLSVSTLRRSRYGANLARMSGLRLAVSGGIADGNRRSEAALMKEFIELEMNQRVALVEEQSTSTRENAFYIARRLEALKLQTVVLVTDVLHMPRAAAAFEALGLRVIRAPTGFKALDAHGYKSLLPSLEGLEQSVYLTHELLGMAWFRFRKIIVDSV